MGRLAANPSPAKTMTLKLDAVYFKYLIGRWNFEIGDWQGFIEFEGNLADGWGPAFWTERGSAKKHYGHWYRISKTEVGWQFNDDPKDWRRVFRVELNGFSCDGKITINKNPHGFFKIWTTRTQ